MGRYLSNTESSQELLTVWTDDTVTAGDLLANTEKGRAVVIGANSNLELYDNNTEGLVVAKALANVDSSIVPALGTAQPNNQLVVDMGDTLISAISGTTTTNVQLMLSTLAGEMIIAPFNVMTGNWTHFFLLKLSSTRVAIIWTNGTEVRFSVYDEELNLITGNVLVAAVSVAKGQFHGSALHDGSFVIVYKITATGYLTFQRYTTEGVISGSAVTITTSTTSLAYVSVQGLDAGGFVVSWFRDSLTYFARYNSSGTLQGSITSITGSSGTIPYGAYDRRIVVFASGGFAILASNASTNPFVSVYNSAGSLQATITPTVAGVQAGNQPGFCRTANGFALAVHITAYIIAIYEYNTSGTLLKSMSVTFAEQQGTDNVSNGIVLIELPFVGFVLGRSSYVSTTHTVAWCVVSRTGLLLGSIVTSTATAIRKSFHMHLTEDGVLLVRFYPTSLTVMDGYYHTLRKAILGVAISGSSGGQVIVGTKGLYTLNADFTEGHVFDCRAYTVRGAWGIVSGNKATLYGVSTNV